MTTYYRTGESISGKKIYYCFGETKHGSGRGNLSLNGEAEVLKPLRGPATQAQGREIIRCKTAKYTCGHATQEKQKVPCGNHKCFEGYLHDNATCTIQVPRADIPAA